MRPALLPRPIRRALLAAALVHAGCTETAAEKSSTGMEPLPPVPDICDGSDEIRLYVADWAHGASDPAVDYVMYAEGMRYLKIDGHCHYYVFDGESRGWRWWEPVREGDFTAEELAAVVERLQVARWGTYAPEDLEYWNMHPEWEHFDVAGEEHFCPSGCPPEVLVMLQEARELTAELARVSEPVVPEILEAVVVERLQDNNNRPFRVPWGASTPMAQWIDPPVQRDFYLDGPDQMGTEVRAADEPWFVEMTQGYLEANGPGGPNEIGIEGENGEALHGLLIRTVVPAFGEAP